MRGLLALLLALCGSLAMGDEIERIQQCRAHCNQGLHCKTKQHFYFAPCKRQPEGLSDTVFLNTSVATVMKCEGRQRCSLHLRVRSALQVSEHIQGVSVCTISAGMMEHCRSLIIPRVARQRLLGQQVVVQNDCFEVGVGQDVRVTLKTVPEFCGLTFTTAYRVPECSNDDLRNNVPECITGKIAYKVDSVRKELSVTVSDMLEDKDYNLRLCHRGYTCRGTGAHVLLKKENPFKNATFQYSKSVPCLCIEGWSSMIDAPRIQVCPFKNHVEELWSGVTFDPVEETLSWEPTCHVEAVITLCQALGDNVCQDLANSSQTVHKGRVTFSTVDPHPQLCIKFTTAAGSWVKCPFAEGNFPAWDLGVTTRDGRQQLVVTSRIRTTLSLGLCAERACAEEGGTVSIHMEKFESVVPNLTMDVCEPNNCIQARRTDVKYAVTVLHCNFQCSLSPPKTSPEKSGWEVMWMVVPAVALSTAVIVAAAVAGVLMMVYQRRRIKKGRGVVHPSEHCAAARSQAADPLAPNQTAFQDESASYDYQETHTPDTASFGSCERANLLTAFTVDLKV